MIQKVLCSILSCRNSHIIKLQTNTANTSKNCRLIHLISSVNVNANSRSASIKYQWPIREVRRRRKVNCWANQTELQRGFLGGHEDGSAGVSSGARPCRAGRGGARGLQAATSPPSRHGGGWRRSSPLRRAETGAGHLRATSFRLLRRLLEQASPHRLLPEARTSNMLWLIILFSPN
jgi:hypothetical protein